MTATAERPIVTLQGGATFPKRFPEGEVAQPDEIRIALDVIAEQPRCNVDGQHYLDFDQFYLSQPSESGLPKLPKPIRMSAAVRKFLETVRPQPKTIEVNKVRERLNQGGTLTVVDGDSGKKPKVRIRSSKTKESGSYVSLPADGNFTVLFHAEMSPDGTKLLFIPRIAGADACAGDWFGKQSPSIERRILNRLGVRTRTRKFPHPVRIETTIGFELSPYWRTDQEKWFGRTKWIGPDAILYSYPTPRVAFDNEPPYRVPERSSSRPTNEEFTSAFVQSVSYLLALQENLITVNIA